jgi:hypothetical protein
MDPSTYPSLRDELEWTFGRIVTETMAHVEGEYFEKATDNQLVKGLANIVSGATNWKNSFAQKLTTTVFASGKNSGYRNFESEFENIPWSVALTTDHPEGYSADDWKLSQDVVEFGATGAFGAAPPPQTIEAGPSIYPIEISTNRDWIRAEWVTNGVCKIYIPTVAWDGNWHGHVFFKQGKQVSQWTDLRGTRITSTNWDIIKSVDVYLKVEPRELNGTVKGTIFKPADPTQKDPPDFDHLATITGTVSGKMYRAKSAMGDGFYRSSASLWVTLKGEYAGDALLCFIYGDVDEIPMAGNLIYPGDLRFDTFLKGDVIGEVHGYSIGSLNPLPFSIDYVGSLIMFDEVLRLRVDIY